jgi:hypothetical protein
MEYRSHSSTRSAVSRPILPTGRSSGPSRSNGSCPSSPEALRGSCRTSGGVATTRLFGMLFPRCPLSHACGLPSTPSLGFPRPACARLRNNFKPVFWTPFSGWKASRLVRSSCRNHSGSPFLSRTARPITSAIAPTRAGIASPSWLHDQCCLRALSVRCRPFLARGAVSHAVVFQRTVLNWSLGELQGMRTALC